MADWPTLVLAAGRGTRARPLAFVRAKPAFPVAGVPLIGRILRALSAFGVRNAVLNLHHLPHTITRVVGDGADFGLRVRYSWEPDLLGSAGGPRRALPILGAPRFLIVNGDTLSDVDLDAMCDQHATTGASVTMALVPHPVPGRYGGVSVDDQGRVTGFTPRGATGPSWHFVGIQAVEAGVFAHLSPDQPSDSVGDVYRDLIERNPGSVRAFCCDARFRDIGTPLDYLQTSLELGTLGEVADRAFAGADGRIDPAASIARSVLWDRVVVGAGVELDQCVVADEVVIQRGSRFSRASIVRASDGVAGPGDIVVGDLIVSPLATWPTPHSAETGSSGPVRGGPLF
jgi:mannose-1-phosphate guanylyltransferase